MSVTVETPVSNVEHQPTAPAEHTPTSSHRSGVVESLRSFIAWAWIPVAMWVGARVMIAITWLSAGPYRGGSAIWDSVWYYFVVTDGYSTQTPTGMPPDSANIAFFPAYPMASRAVHTLTPLSPYWALHVVALLCGLIATVMFFAMVRSLFGPERATAATALFAFSTGSFALSMLYSEGLFLIAAIGCCWLLIRERYLLAGLFGALGTATRPTGVVLIGVCAFAVVIADRATRVRALAAPGLASVGIISYFVFLRALSGSWTIYFEVQRDGWGDKTTLIAGRATELRALLDWSYHDGAYVLVAVVSVVGLAMVVAGLRQLRLEGAHPVLMAYGVLMALMLWSSYAVGFRPRMVMAVFPVFIGLAGIFNTRGRFTMALTVSIVAAIALARVYLTGKYIIP